MPFKDLEKRREFRRNWYLKNKESEKEHVKKRKLGIRRWFENYKIKLKCKKCQENHPATIDFHHKEGEEKERNISYLVSNGYSVEKIQKELKKCQVLCANCHRKLYYHKSKNL
jgi:hypothetical protein